MAKLGKQVKDRRVRVRLTPRTAVRVAIAATCAHRTIPQEVDYALTQFYDARLQRVLRAKEARGKSS